MDRRNLLVNGGGLAGGGPAGCSQASEPETRGPQRYRVIDAHVHVFNAGLDLPAHFSGASRTWSTVENTVAALRQGDFLGDRELQALASRGGVLGIHFYSSYLGSGPTPQRVVEQVDYIAAVAGIETVALGVDFFPTEGPWADFQRAQGITEIAWAVPDMGPIVQVTEALLAHHYSEEDIQRILGGNFLRVCQEVWEK